MLTALIKKELRQIQKDKSILVIAFVLPLLLIFIYGFGLNLDIDKVKIAVQCDINEQGCQQVFYQLAGSNYLQASNYLTKSAALEDFNKHLQHAIVMVDHDEILLYINAKSAHLASLIEGYLLQSLSPATDGIKIIARNRFNEENISAYFLLPGQLIGIITLICAFMSSLLIAREYDRNTVLLLRCNDVTAQTIILSKLVPYYLLSTIGSLLAIAIALIVFNLPFRGSLVLFALTLAAYILMANCMGLLISVLVKDQFLSSEYAIIISLLPSLLLSGALFDLKAASSFIYYLSYAIPPRYAVESFKLSFLSDQGSSTMLSNLAILLGFALAFYLASVTLLHKDLKR